MNMDRRRPGISQSVSSTPDSDSADHPPVKPWPQMLPPIKSSVVFLQLEDLPYIHQVRHPPCRHLQSYFSPYVPLKAFTTYNLHIYIGSLIRTQTLTSCLANLNYASRRARIASIGGKSSSFGAAIKGTDLVLQKNFSSLQFLIDFFKLIRQVQDSFPLQGYWCVKKHSLLCDLKFYSLF